MNLQFVEETVEERCGFIRMVQWSLNMNSYVRFWFYMTVTTAQHLFELLTQVILFGMNTFTI